MNITPEPMETVDRVSLCLDLIRTAHLALQDKSMLDNRAIDAVANVLSYALANLEPVYITANKIHGEGKL